MRLTDTAKNAMLDALTINRIRLHSGDPGASGTDNALGSLTAATFNAASGGSRALNADVPCSSLGASAPVQWYSIWNSTGPVFHGAAELTGDAQADSAGNYTVKATGTSFSVDVAS